MKSFLKKFLTLLSFISLLTLVSCAPHLGGDDYDAKSVGQVSTTLKGIITSARKVKIRAGDNTEPGVGAVAGGLGGAALGSTVGGGNKMPVVGAVVGGLAGGFAGHGIEQKLKEQEGLEYQVRLDNGSLVTIAQGKDPKLSVGQRVLVIKNNRGRSRIIADNTN